MVIDAANGVEPQTRRLLQVCRARNTPILTFVNKMDREVKAPLDLFDEIEAELGMSVVPFHLAGGHGQVVRRRARPAPRPDARVLRRRGPPEGRRRHHRRPSQPALAQRFGTDYQQAAGEVELVREAAPGFDEDAFLSAGRRRCSSARRSTTSACRRCWTRWSTWRRRRAEGRAAAHGAATGAQVQRRGASIQANMDPAHRDRIAFPARGRRPLRAWHAAEGHALGQGAAAEHGGVLPEPAPRAAGRGLRRRHHRHPQPRRAAARRHAERRRGAAVHRAAVLRAGDVPLGRGGRPAAQSSCAPGSRSSAKKARSGVPPGGRQRAAAGRVGSCSSRWWRTGWSTNTAARRASCRRATTSRAGSPAPKRARGQRARAQALHRRQCPPRGADAVDAPCVLLEYAGELRAMQENWPKIKFHALREHAGLVFQKQSTADGGLVE